MNDRVIGTAILDTSVTPHELFLFYKADAAKHRGETCIPVYPRGTPKPDVNHGSSWEYSVQGDILHVTPSLHIRFEWPYNAAGEFDEALRGNWKTEFHNDGHWDVRFWLMSADVPDGPEDSYPGQSRRALRYKQLAEANLSD